MACARVGQATAASGAGVAHRAAPRRVVARAAGGSGGARARGEASDRRSALLAGGGALLAAAAGARAPEAQAIGFKKELKKRRVPLSEYTQQPGFQWLGEPHEGLKVYDEVVGKGREAVEGANLTTHFEVYYRNVLVESSREGRLIGRNATLEEPLSFACGFVPPKYTVSAPVDYVVGVGLKLEEDLATGEKYALKVYFGSPAQQAGVPLNSRLAAVDGESVAGMSTERVGELLRGDGEEGGEVVLSMSVLGGEPIDYKLARASYAVPRARPPPPPQGANGLYNGEAGAQAPAALFLAVRGMREGGKRLVRVTPDVGYGPAGRGEIPAGESFSLKIELLKVSDA